MSEKVPSDEILLNSMKAGDLESFNLLFERYWDKLFTTVFAICPDPEVCSGIVHDIFLNLWLKRDKLEIDYFKGYITASARYQIYRYVKSIKKKTIEYREELDFGNLVAVNDGESNIRYRELEKKVEEELEELPSRCREIFTLSRMQQLSNDEIAARLDISKRTVENQLTYALRHLRLSIRQFLFILHTLLAYNSIP
jgi:RNA polymerase sigma-70 factor (family 1)